MPANPFVDVARPLRIVAVGAHPDDIELGAGALLYKALAAGHEVSLLVLTDHPAKAQTRRREALDAAAVIGLAPEQVQFAGFTDGHLRVNASTVHRVRELLTGVRPDVVVTHAAADSHNDHIEAHRIAHAAFRNAVFLHYSIHVSAEPSRFEPQVFVEVAGERADVKRRALAAHPSQQATIDRRDLSEYESALGAPARMARAEAFELELQAGVPDATVRAAMALSESPFHRFWLPVVGGSTVTALYPSAWARSPEPELHLNAGRDRLRQAFVDRWGSTRLPLRELFANDPDAASALLGGSVVLSGNPTDNVVVRDVYNKVSAARWVVDGRAGETHLLDRVTAERRYPERSLDYGVIARIDHPTDDQHTVVYAGGTTALGTRAALGYLADPGAFAQVNSLLTGGHAAEVVFSVDRSLDDLQVVDFSMHHPRAEHVHRSAA